ncbi:MAG: SEC-C metal-binding domain-containing protein, partial [Alphaproteobacteria bacterium]
GMTGTAMTEAEEFEDIYKLQVVSIPTNVQVNRSDHDDEVYRTVAEKHTAVVELVRDCQKRKQPILLGTVSIEKSESLSAALKKAKVPHQVLNARYHAQEAAIIADAGRPGAVTIATNMAGRGTDIQLGGNPERRVAEALAAAKDGADADAIRDRVTRQIAADRAVALAAGGLFVVGTERHESRRIDNQLRGRSGRQGDPGASRFLLSRVHDLLRIFGSGRIDGMLRRLGIEEGEAIVHPWINKALEKAQQKVEARNFEIRKNLLKYDDVMNDQRKVVYEQRREFMGGEDVSDIVREMRHDIITDMVARAMPEKTYAEQWDMDGLQDEARRVLALDLPIVDWTAEEGVAEDTVVDRLTEASDALMARKEQDFGPQVLRMAEKSILLQLLDQSWKDHLLSLDHLRQGIVLRAYGQKDPLNEYKREAFGLFESMLNQMRENVTAVLSHVRIQTPDAAAVALPSMGKVQETRRDPALAGIAPSAGGPAALPSSAGLTSNRLADSDTPGGPLRSRSAADAIDPDDPTTWGRVPRNAPCPCGSGKKYKHCHGQT